MFHIVCEITAPVAASAEVLTSLLFKFGLSSSSRSCRRWLTIPHKRLSCMHCHVFLTSTYGCKVMDLLGPSLWDLWSAKGQSMNPQHVACIAVEALYILQQLHAKGCGPSFCLAN